MLKKLLNFFARKNYSVMNKVTCIDFEIANRQRSSICSVGISVWENGVEIDSFYSLAKPEPYKFERLYQKVHGLTYADVDSAPTFAELYPNVKKYLSTYVVAHNAEFDMDCLSAWLYERKMPFPDFKYLCTRRIAEMLGEPSASLDDLCGKYGIEICEKHNSLCDARACGKLFHKLLPLTNSEDLLKIASEFGILVYKEISQIEEAAICNLWENPKPVDCAVETKADLPYRKVDSIDFSKKFVVSGEFVSLSRKDVENKIKALGGKLQSTANSKTSYIIVGGLASDGWANGNYGRKIQEALSFPNIVFIRESDFAKFI